jgi:hypothetical protein
VPERPWWSHAPTGFLRTDGKIAATIHEAAEIDYANPLPRPAFAVGQVWLMPFGEGSRTYTIGGRLEVNAKALYWNIIGPYIPHQLSDDHLQEYLVDSFLLFDPYTHKAPWAPWKL